MIYLELKTAKLTEKAVSIFFVGCMFSHMMTQPPPLAFTVTEDTWGRCRACRCDTMAWEQRCLVLPRLINVTRSPLKYRQYGTRVPWAS